MKSHGVKKVLWIQHRDKLTSQNADTFKECAGSHVHVSIFDSKYKNISGDVIFGMVQTVANYIEHMPKFDMVVIDEAHHCPSSTYIKIVKAVRKKNPDVILFGMTATPVRSDKKTMRVMFDNVAYIVPLPDLIANGVLVPPRTLKPVVPGMRESLGKLDVKPGGENDMDEVAAIVDRPIVHDEVVRQWKLHASRLKTMVFCANVAHCEHVAEAFRRANVRVAVSHSKLKKKDRDEQEKRFDEDKAQVLVNVMVMTEGYDDQRLGCVIILRTCVADLTFIQIVGRALRKLDQKKFPGWTKEEGLILDFATQHESLEQQVEDALRVKKKTKKAPRDLKVCPTCLAALPAQSRECAFCGHVFPVPKGPEAVDTVEMREIDLLASSRFAWLDVFNKGRCTMASGFDAHVVVVKPWDDRDGWVAFGRKGNDDVEALGMGDKADAMAFANAWLKDRDKRPETRKGASWMTSKPTPRQTWALAAGEWGKRWSSYHPMTRYAAACRVHYQSTEKMIIDKLKTLDEEFIE